MLIVLLGWLALFGYIGWEAWQVGYSVAAVICAIVAALPLTLAILHDVWIEGIDFDHMA